MFAIGEFKDRVSILVYEQTETGWAWKETAQAWAKVEPQANLNVFSKIGEGRKAVKITLRKRDLTMHHALRWNGRHCFISDIVELDQRFLKLSAAFIEPVECRATHTEQTLDALNRPTVSTTKPLPFEGFLVRKYQGGWTGFKAVEKEPQTELETLFVLITPKAIVLSNGDLVQVGTSRYAVQTVYTLDETKNEYEVKERRDA